MNSSLDEARYDRLVDGQLSDREYRELLAALDEDPGGWRKCALAFLEAQAWGREFQSLRAAPWSAECAAPKVAPPQQSSPSSSAASWPALLLAMAASFVAAFGLSIFFRGTHGPAERELVPSESAIADLAPLQAPDSTSDSVPSAANLPEPVANVTLVVDGPQGAEAQRYQVPVYPWENADALWSSSTEPSVPQDVLSALERLGHEVHSQRQYVPVQLQDGRRAVMPVEQLEIVPVGGQRYQ